MNNTAPAVQGEALPALIDAHGLMNAHQHNQQMAQRAIVALRQKAEYLATIDLTTLAPEQGAALDSELNDYIVRGKNTVKVLNDTRKPFTAALDAIKKQFTSFENEVEEALAPLVSKRNEWGREVLRRQQEQARKQQEELNRKNAEADYLQAVVEAISFHHSAQLRNDLDKLNQAFYNQTLETIDQYGQTLRAWSPSWQPFNYNVAPNSLLTGDEMLQIRARVQTESYDVAQKVYIQKMTEERDRLLELIPSRKMELERIANDAEAAAAAKAREEQERQERERRLQQEEEDRKAAAARDAEAAKMNNLFDQAATARPVASVANGTVVKKKYAATTHKAVAAIMQYWVTNHLHLMTVEELTKKLSFMFTAANKALNEGKKIEAEGLFIEDDLTTRATRAKKDAVAEGQG